MICAASSMTRLSYWNARLTKSLRLMAACVHVIATTCGRESPTSAERAAESRPPRHRHRLCVLGEQVVSAVVRGAEQLEGAALLELLEEGHHVPPRAARRVEVRRAAGGGRKQRRGRVGEEVGEGEVALDGPLLVARAPRLRLERLPPRRDRRLAFKLKTVRTKCLNLSIFCF